MKLLIAIGMMVLFTIVFMAASDKTYHIEGQGFVYAFLAAVLVLFIGSGQKED